MTVEHASVSISSSSGEQLCFRASVTPALDGSWLTQIYLDEGVSITNRFTDEAEAKQYPAKLLRWLRQQEGS